MQTITRDYKTCTIVYREYRPQLWEIFWIDPDLKCFFVGEIKGPDPDMFRENKQTKQIPRFTVRKAAA